MVHNHLVSRMWFHVGGMGTSVLPVQEKRERYPAEAQVPGYGHQTACRGEKEQDHAKAFAS